MILFNKDINNIRYLVNEMKKRALIDCNLEVVTFCEQVLYLANYYQDEHEDDYHDKHERKAYSFLMRFAEEIGITKTYRNPAEFHRRFFEQLSCYKSLERRFDEKLRGDN